MATVEQKKNWKKTWRDKMVKQGLCSGCGKEPLISTLYGLKCLRRIRTYYRKRKGFVGWSHGRRGTVPYEHRTGPITFPVNFTRGFRLVRVNRNGLTAYYGSTNRGSNLKGAWITVSFDKKAKAKLVNKRKHG